MILKQPTVSFYTLGCRVNQSETAVLQNMLEDDGFRVVDFESPAQIVVINTCTVTARGDADTKRMVNRISRKHHQTKIALIGCQSQVQGARLASLKNVCWIVGTEAKMDLGAILKNRPQPDSGPQVFVSPIRRKKFTMPSGGADRQHTRANLKIQDGCDFFCSYCEIPYARGRPRSRVYQDLLKAAQNLAEAGHKEIVLTGINLGLYRDGNYTLKDVIGDMQSIPGLARIRISSVEFNTFPDLLLKHMFPKGKLCRYLHVPLQSGEDDVLQRMNRRYTTGEFSAWLKHARKQVPYLCVGTDVIVGFPGEDGDAFDRTYEFLKSQPFQYFHVFSYSKRQRAKSRNFSGEIPAHTIRKRSEILRALSLQKRRAFFESLEGKVEPVLFEEEKNGCWSGLSDNFVRVRVKSPLNLKNQIIPVRLEKPVQQYMVGTMVR